MSKKGLHVLLQELSDNELEDVMDGSSGLNIPAEDPDRPWSRHFHEYMDTLDQVPDDWSAIKWWGVSSIFSSIFLNLDVHSSVD